MKCYLETDYRCCEFYIVGVEEQTLIDWWSCSHYKIGFVSASGLFSLLFKALIGIISKLESMFKQFLWSGSEDEQKISWVKWDMVRRPIDEWGVGY